MSRVLVSLHHTHGGHSGVLIDDEGVLPARDPRASAVGWVALQGDRPGLLSWPDGHAVAGGLLRGGAAAAEVLFGGRRASAVVAGGAWIAAARPDPPATTVAVRYTGPDGSETGRGEAVV